MTTKSKEQLNYQQLKLKLNLIKCDITFLKKCNREKVFPKFINLKCGIKNSRTEKTLFRAKRLWLNLELKHHYARLEVLNVKVYELHLKLSNCMSFAEWLDFDYHVKCTIETKRKEKIETLMKKFSALKRNSNARLKPTVKDCPNVVVNLSSEDFSVN